MTGPETPIEQHLTKRAREAGGMSVKMLPTIAGVPDRLILLPPGNIFLVELKAPDGRLRPAQRVWHGRASRVGVEVFTLWSKKDVDIWIDAMLTI